MRVVLMSLYANRIPSRDSLEICDNWIFDYLLAPLIYVDVGVKLEP